MIGWEMAVRLCGLRGVLEMRVHVASGSIRQRTAVGERDFKLKVDAQRCLDGTVCNEWHLVRDERSTSWLSVQKVSPWAPMYLEILHLELYHW